MKATDGSYDWSNEKNSQLNTIKSDFKNINISYYLS